MKDLLIKIGVPLLIALTMGTFKFAMDTSTRLTILEYRVNYTLGPPPWATKGPP